MTGGGYVMQFQAKKTLTHMYSSSSAIVLLHLLSLETYIEHKMT